MGSHYAPRAGRGRFPLLRYLFGALLLYLLVRFVGGDVLGLW